MAEYIAGLPAKRQHPASCRGKGSRGDPSLPKPSPLRLAGVHNLGLLGGLLTLVVASGRWHWPQELQASSIADKPCRGHPNGVPAQPMLYAVR